MPLNRYDDKLREGN